MSNRTYQCHACNRVNNYNQKFCNNCETPAAVAALRSTGKDILPCDFLFALLPIEQSVGSGIHSDVLLPLNDIPAHHCNLEFSRDLFTITSPASHLAIRLNGKAIKVNQKYRLEHGCLISFANEEFELIYFNKKTAAQNYKNLNSKTWLIMP
ncbi:FHA domain-containing protein [Lentisphaera profundi]|uniref:FHA domain-containing protein n=1 Tax=Lentisphaera profundi TaxID=1658616 RepID=A0ABY7VVX6_9BACT|nr:FHA domain-containing protein [Lentisphaera profundi]WDE97867.1 FHA domain-containing protein [Lentisphaera profundi]